MLPLRQFHFVAVAEGDEKFILVMNVGSEWADVASAVVDGLIDYATLRQSVAGNSTFWGIVFCNLGTPKTVISHFVTMQQIETPYLSPYGYPNNVPGGQNIIYLGEK